MSLPVAIALVALMVFTGVLAVPMIIYIDKQSRKGQTSIKGSVSVKSKRIAKYYRKYERYDNFFLTRGGIRKVNESLATMSIYSKEEIIENSVKIYGKTLYSFWIVIGISIIAFQDLFSVLVVGMLAIVIKQSVVDRQLDKIHYTLLKELLNAIASIKQQIRSKSSIPDAIANAEKGSLLIRPLENIYLVLVSPDGESRLETFFSSTPFSTLKTLMAVCYIVDNYGEAEEDTDSSSFIDAMTSMENEVRLEIQKLSKQKAAFGTILAWIPVAPVLVARIIEWYFLSIIPGTAGYYGGFLGHLVKVLIVLFATLGFLAVSKVNNAVTTKRDDRSNIVLGLLNIKVFDSIVENILPKTLRKINTKNRRLRNALSRVTLKHLYGKKLLYAMTALFVGIVVLVFATTLSKEFIYSNVRELSLVSSEVLDEAGIKQRQEMDAIYLSYDKKMNKSDTESFVESYMDSEDPFVLETQVSRLEDKYDLYHNTQFKWWYLLLAYMMAVIAWFIPEIQIMARGLFLKLEAEDDVLQLQTLLTIIMNTNADTLDCLDWLSRLSRVHKNSLTDAYLEYPCDSEMALNRLKSATPLDSFKRLIDVLLLTVDQISLKEAFRDLASEKDHILRLREIKQDKTIKSKRALVSPLVNLPGYMVLILYFILPIAILGAKEFIKGMQF